jgi:hypothetical protein
MYNTNVPIVVDVQKVVMRKEEAAAAGWKLLTPDLSPLSCLMNVARMNTFCFVTSFFFFLV